MTTFFSKFCSFITGKNADDDDFDQDADVDYTDFEDADDWVDDAYYDEDYDGDGGDAQQGGENNDDGGDRYDGFDPYYDFDIETCDTYENLWIWDLSLTCESDEDLDDCECIFSEELMDLGLLSCSDASSCPSACPICATCMQLMGCTSVTTGISSERTSNTVYVVAAAIGLLVFGLVYFTVRRQREDDGDLQAHLMADEQLESTPPPPTPPQPAEPTVWLAPDAPPAQFEPSARAAAGLSVHIPEDMMMEPMSILSSRPTFTQPQDDQVWLAPVT